MRLLDLGCGRGLTAEKLGLPLHWDIVGVDVDESALSVARSNYPSRTFLQAQGEHLPFANASFDRVVSNVALPYMSISKALREIRRVLIPDGELWASLHPASFTVSELRRAWPKPIAMLYRISVLASGVVFHMTGRNWTESFQTRSGMSRALRQAGFVNLTYNHDGKRWFVTCTSGQKPTERTVTRLR